MSFRFATIYFSSCIPCTYSAPTIYLPSFTLRDCVTLGPSRLPIPRCIHHSVPSIWYVFLCHLFCSLIFFSLDFFLFLGFFLLYTWVESIGVSLLLICLQTWKEQADIWLGLVRKILTRSHDLGAVTSQLRNENSTTDPQPPPRLHPLQWTESSFHHSEHLLTDGRYPAGFLVVCFYLVFSVSPRETRRR